MTAASVRDSDAAPVVRCLDAEIDALRALVALVRDEQAALRAADADALARVVRAKQAQVGLVERMTTQRRDALAALGVADSRAAIDAWLEAHPDAGPAAARFALLISLAQDALAENTLNARLAARQQRHFERAADSLARAAGRTGVYGADGRTHALAGSRALAAI